MAAYLPRCILFCIIFLLISACASSGRNSVDEEYSSKKFVIDKSIESANQQLETDANLHSRRVYRLGGGDKIDVLVYLADDFSRVYQINANGQIKMPLVGAINVGRLTVSEAQDEIARVLAKRYIRDPQVLINIVEYSAHEITVLGEVSAPRIYRVKEGRNPFEMLIMAGGFTKNAGLDIHITTRQFDSQISNYRTIKTIVDRKTLFNPESAEDYEKVQKIRSMVLGDGDSLLVPAAGRVYIDGAVKKPGVYMYEEDMTILGLMIRAGGEQWTTSDRNVRILRNVDDDLKQDIDINLARIKNNKETDFPLKPGDTILVGHNAIKYGLKAFWEYGMRLLFIF